MRIILSERTGFCFGVKRAVNMAEEALKKNISICSLGHIIHNRQVVDDLSKKGLKVAHRGDSINSKMVVISSHGISPNVAKRIRGRGIKIIDTTCPFVLNAQRIAKNLSAKGYKVVIVGDINHPEIRALLDFVAAKAFVVKDARQALGLKVGKSEIVSIISQTTQSTKNFLEVVQVIAGKMPGELRIFNTICRDAEDRQRFAKSLAEKVDVMLVIGGKNSANTKRLLEVCKEVLNRSHLIETEKELDRNWFKKCRVIGITSGASTPDWVVNKVVNKLKYDNKSKRKGSCN